MKRARKIKITSLPLFAALLAIGFGAGYTAHEVTKSPQTIFKQPVQPAVLSSLGPITVCFTPNKQCQSKIISEIGGAKKSIFVQAYSFTDKDIAMALAAAASRGVDVKVLLDKSNQSDNRSAKDILLYQNIPLRFDAPSGIAHNKIMIIDETKVISGSYNFSAAAYKRNTENLLVISNPSLAHSYLQNWRARWLLSTGCSQSRADGQY
jgi:phosphatidylserine/phosphatidylglycerophosphate/cardiolipin synthase-like enzyme